ncbi:cardiolipin synthase [Kerstersia similis]|uniref:cardiolipin synthase n=1 Tax=Kerstersia similis TaxID=206505 RepID=UPI0039EEBBF0
MLQKAQRPVTSTQTLEYLFHEYWPHIIFVVSLVISLAAAVHIAMTKRDARAAIGWVGVVMLSPILGTLLYIIAGINRVREKRVSQQRSETHLDAYPDMRPSDVDLLHTFGAALAGQKTLGDRVSEFPLLDGNLVQILAGGDNTYPAMLEAIRNAKTCIAMQSYIFDHDRIGMEIAQALVDAHQRGVQVRVLVDAVGEKYSHPPISRIFAQHKVPHARFMSTGLGFRLAYANMRSHRKILVIDGCLGFTGGMNIREAFTHQYGGDNMALDTHFRLEGPIVSQLMYGFAHDWEFTTGESLYDTQCDWFPVIPTPGYVPARCVPSGPDQALGSNHSMIMGALAAAQHHVMIQTPYFLPDPALIGALATTARRGVTVDIVIPGQNNLRLVDFAMKAQIDLVIANGCRVWRTNGGFDHSKLMTLDDTYSYVGSSNMDPRSLRLNFEMDVEIYDRNTADWIKQRIQSQIDSATLVTLEHLNSQPFLNRLRNKIIWLASPYL